MIAIQVNDEEITLADVLTLAKFNERLQFVQDAVDAALVRQMAEELGIEVSEDELQQAADDFRAERRLYDVAATEQWLTEKPLSFDAWGAMIEGQLLACRVRNAVTGKKIEPYFVQHRLDFDRATISRLLVAEEELARELRAQIADEDADFHALARRHSTEAATRPMGGYAGEVKRGELPAALQSAVFGGQPGEIAGPVRTREGWLLVLIEALRPSTLDEPTRAAIEALLYDEWLAARRKAARIRMPVLEEG